MAHMPLILFEKVRNKPLRTFFGISFENIYHAPFICSNKLVSGSHMAAHAATVSRRHTVDKNISPLT